MARRNFRRFIEDSWSVVEPAARFVPGMHIDAIAEHLQAVAEGQIQRLAICVPPGCAKSLTAAVQWPAWLWTREPALRFMFAAYSSALSIRDSVRCRRVVESPWYQQRWGHLFKLSADENEKRRFTNNRSGARLSTSTGSTATGDRCDILCVDDILSVSQADSDAEREFAIEWFFSTLPSRLNDQRTGRMVVIGQRLHEADLIGELIARDAGYEVLSLPAEFDPRNRCVTCLWSDPRTEDKELLWPAKLGTAELDRLRRQLGSRRFESQYNQAPAPQSGALWKREWIRFYRKSELPTLDRIVLSWDATFKDSKDSDYVSGQAWGTCGANRYLLGRFHKQADFVQTVAAIQNMVSQYPGCVAVLVEDKANGPAIISTLKSKVRGLIAINPEGSKVARASAVQPQFEAGQVFVPSEEEAPWIEDVIAEWTAFPNAKHDDDVDAASQALNWLGKRSFDREVGYRR